MSGLTQPWPSLSYHLISWPWHSYWAVLRNLIKMHNFCIWWKLLRLLSIILFSCLVFRSQMRNFLWDSAFWVQDSFISLTYSFDKKNQETLVCHHHNYTSTVVRCLLSVTLSFPLFLENNITCMSFTVNYPQSIPPSFTERETADILKKQMNEMNCVEINVYLYT